MPAPNVGDQFVGVRPSGALGKSLTWRVTKIDRKADAIDYVELASVDDPFQKKVVSVGALTDGRMFSPVTS